MDQDEPLKGYPDDLRALFSQAHNVEQLRVLKALVQQGLDDACAGDVVDWDLKKFLTETDYEQSEQRIAQR
jgi:hypothetical protein